MSEVFLCANGQLSAKSRSELRKAGVIVVEVDDPSRCQFIRSTELVSGDEMLWAAMDALRRTFGNYDKGSQQREQFALNVWEIIDAARQKKAAPPAEGTKP